MKDREWKESEVKLKRELEELFFKPIIVYRWYRSVWRKRNEENKGNENTWCDWLNNYIPEPVRKNASCFKDKVISIFNRDTPKQTVNVWEKKLGKPKTQKQSEENKINSIKKIIL